MNYVNGILEGKSIEYHNNGLINYEHFYKKGKLLYSIKYNYISKEKILKYKIENNKIIII